MKRFLSVALLVLVCVCCLTSCAQVEQEIGKKISVQAVDAVATQFEENSVHFERADEVRLAAIEAALTEEFDMALQGNVTAALIGEETNAQTGEWGKYWVLGFSMTTDAEAFSQLASTQLQDEIKEGKAVVVGGGYIVNVTVSSMIIEQD